MFPVAALALGSAACYALGLVLAQIGLRRQSVLAGATISLPATAVVLWLVGSLRIDPTAVRPAALAIFAGFGLLFPVSVTLLSFQANRLLGPNLAGALGNTTPLFAVAFGILLLGDHLTPQRGLGLAIVVAGVALLSIRPGQGRAWPAAALLVPFAAALIRGLAQPVVKTGLAIWPDPLAATVAGYTSSALVILLIGFGRGRRHRPVWSRRAIPVFCATGLLNGASVLLLYAALTEGQVSLVAPLVATYPLFTLAFSLALLRGEPVGPRFVAGMGVTVAGVATLLTS